MKSKAEFWDDSIGSGRLCTGTRNNLTQLK